MKKLLLTMILLSLAALPIAAAAEGLEIEPEPVAFEEAEAFAVEPAVDEQEVFLGEVPGEAEADAGAAVEAEADESTAEEAEAEEGTAEGAEASDASDFEIVDGVLTRYLKWDEVFELTIPDGVTAIADDAFQNANHFKSLVIPSSVKRIGDRAFSCCANLTYLKLSEGLEYIGDQAFSACPKLTNFTSMPDTVTHLGQDAFRDCEKLTQGHYSAGLTEVPFGAFAGTNLYSLTLPESVTSIAMDAFSGCANLHTLNMSGVTSIGDGAFRGCSALTMVAFPAGLTTIHSHAFEGCSSLKVSYLPSGLTTLDQGAFEGCASLETMTVPGSVECVQSEVFKDCTSLTKVVFHDGVVALGGRMFLNCPKLADLTVPGSVETVDDVDWSVEGTLTLHIDCGSAIHRWLIPLPDDHSLDELLSHITFDFNLSSHTRARSGGQSATCTQPGYTSSVICSFCGTVLEAPTEIPALGHNYAPVAGTPATCAANGLTDGEKCTRCGDVRVPQQVIPALPHTPIALPAVAATETSTGLTEGSMCAVCGTVLVAQQTTPVVVPEIRQVEVKASKKLTNTDAQLGETLKLSVAGKEIKSCKSSNKKVASVTADGTVTAKKAGKAKITVTTRDKKKLTVKVKVVDPRAATKVTLTEGKSVRLKVGETLQLHAVLSPETAQSTLIWKSDKKKIASVTSDGLVTAKKKGTAKITVATGNGKKTTIKVKVSK